MPSDPNDAKASFEELYSQNDPRGYFASLGALDYAIPDLAKPVFRRIASEFRKVRQTAPTILDVGSSYGINAALFRFPLSLDMLRRRYARREMMALTSAEVRAYDRAFYQSWPRNENGRIIALDVSRPAVEYAREVGLVDACLAHDFESGAAATAAELSILADVDMIISTGAVGYVTEKTFDALLKAGGRRPWVVSFVLRMFDFEPIAARLAQEGLVTEKLKSAVFVQRRFQDEEEAQQVIEILKARGIDAAGLESEGLLSAELYVSRPEAESKAVPIDELVRVVSGRNLSFGPRLVQVKREGRRLVAPLLP